MGGSIRVPWISRRLPSSTQTRSTSVWAPASRSVRLPHDKQGYAAHRVRVESRDIRDPLCVAALGRLSPVGRPLARPTYACSCRRCWGA